MPLDGPGDCVGMLLGDGHRAVEAGQEFKNGRTDRVSLGSEGAAKEVVDTEVVLNGLATVEPSMPRLADGGGEPVFVSPVASTRIASVAAMAT